MAEFKTPIKTRNTKRDAPFTIPASPFLKKLGYGTGVSVYELVRSPRTGEMRSPWAIKRVIKSEKCKIMTVYGKRLLEEAKLLKKMNHPNIVGFRALTKMKDGRSCLGMEACGRSLGDMIEEMAKSFTADNILKVALDIGNALDYIHTKVMILHGDIKSYNILINGNFQICKLCDFGVSLNLDENGLVTKKKGNDYIGTELWSAPEVIDGVSLISTKADIFSFGLTLWEMLAMKPPHSDKPYDTDDSVIVIDDQEDSMNFMQDCGTRPLIPDDIDENLYRDVFALFYCMTEALPQQRPTAHHVVLCAEDMIEKRKRGIPYVEFLQEI